MRQKMPGVLWVSIATLVVFAVMQLFIGAANKSHVVLLAAVLNIILAVGMMLARPWAYFATLCFAVIGLFAAVVTSPEQTAAVFVFNVLVIVPMLIATKYFFPEEEEKED